MTENPTTTESEAASDLLVPSDGLNMKTITGDKMTVATAELPEDQRETIRWLYSFIKSKGWSLTEAKSETGLDDSTLYRIFTGKYHTKLDSIVRRINDYRAQYEDRSRAQQSGRVFVETSITKSIWEACDYASATGTMAMVIGPSHYGKTWSLEKFQADHNHGQTKMVRMPASAGVQLCMKEFARACYVSPNSCFENLREYVFKAVDRHNLVIVDELHQVFLSYLRGSAIKCLEVIRELHDRTGCGMVLSGTQKLKDEVMLGEHKDLLNQFTQRVIVEVVLPKHFPWADVNLIAKGYGLDGPKGDDAEIVKLLIKDSGIKRYCLFLRNGQQLAAKLNETFSWKHFIRAHDIVARLAKIGGAK
ncbi:ATPase [soil metagenome]